VAFSLLTDAWLPARRASSRTVTIRPCDITEGIDTDPIVALDWPRPDFRLGSLEFLIGLLATGCPPVDDDDGWAGWWETPPTPQALYEAFAPLAHAFFLDGDGPRFMQDTEAFAGKVNAVETLLIDAPGAQTTKNNADHFIKRDAVTTISRAAAAMALFTLQSFAPAGGAGNRVGLRGGGPLTTLAIPPWRGPVPFRPVPLWHLLWANVPTGQPAGLKELPSIFPWLTATRTSEAGRTTTPGDTHDLAAYWGTSRRIRLEFSPNPQATPCDILAATVDSVVVSGWRQRPYGANYAAWQHPLSPYYRQKPTDAEWLPVHAQPGGVGYRHWVGLLFDDSADAPMRRAASAVKTFRAKRLFQVAEGGERVRWGLLAAGYDMDNMKARGFVESEMPVIEPGNQDRTKDFVLLTRQLVAGAIEAASLLGRSVRRALFSDGAKVAIDAGLFAVVRSRFWDATEIAFLAQVQKAAAAGDPDEVRQAWLRDLAHTTRALFAEAAPIDATGADRRPDRIAGAAKSLDFALNGYGKDGESLRRALGLPLPEKTAHPAKTKSVKAKKP
jgi:CRISPR system Cascade subunit CasA